MDNDDKETFFHKLIYAHFNLMYFTFNKYNPSIFKQYFFLSIEMIHILSLTINDQVKYYIF
jgi:hypothetical protein